MHPVQIHDALSIALFYIARADDAAAPALGLIASVQIGYFYLIVSLTFFVPALNYRMHPTNNKVEAAPVLDMMPIQFSHRVIMACIEEIKLRGKCIRCFFPPPPLVSLLRKLTLNMAYSNSTFQVCDTHTSSETRSMHRLSRPLCRR